MLYDAELCVFPSGYHYLTGLIYNDKSTYGNHPLPDGTLIHTSDVTKIITDGDNLYYITDKATYKEVK